MSCLETVIILWKAIVDLAHNIGLKVTVEGEEAKNNLSFCVLMNAMCCKVILLANRYWKMM
jgi:hypothetical protein